MTIDADIDARGVMVRCLYCAGLEEGQRRVDVDKIDEQTEITNRIATCAMSRKSRSRSAGFAILTLAALRGLVHGERGREDHIYAGNAVAKITSTRE